MLETITSERRALVAELRELAPDDWGRPSLCTGWTVHQVLAHLCTPFLVSAPRMGVAVLRRRGIAPAMQQVAVDLAARHSPADLLDVLERNAGSAFHPPTLPLTAPLTDLVAHGCDIRWALSAQRADVGRPERLRAVLDFLCGPKARRGFVPPARLRGLRLVATDLGWSHGEGAEVAGPALALVMGVLGRPAAVPELSGGERLLAG